MPYKNPKERKTYYKAYHAAHQKERKAYYQVHREEYNLRVRLWNAAHREERKVYSKVYYITHREERRIYMRNYVVTHREERNANIKIWRIAHPEVVRIMERKAVARRRGYGYCPLNIYFPNSVGHHITDTDVVFIPKNIHKSCFCGPDKEEHREKVMSLYGSLENMIQGYLKES